MSLIFSAEIAARQRVATSVIETAIVRGRLAHALLLSGRAKADKWAMAKSVASFANCTAGLEGQDKFGGGSCPVRFTGLSEADFNRQACQNCRWIAHDQHPHAWLSLTTEGSRAGKISVEKARLLSDELGKVSQFTRIIVIENASQESFHRPAANALLKTIEDPKQGSIFIAFANREEDVLSTVVSRCQVIPLVSSESNQSPLADFMADKKLSFASDDALLKEKSAVRLYLSRHADVKQGKSVFAAIEFSQLIGELINDDFSTQQAIDLAVELEAERIGKNITDERQSLYFRDLLTLAEEAKLQIIHYVSAKSAVESFCLAWWQLKITGYVKAR